MHPSHVPGPTRTLHQDPNLAYYPYAGYLRIPGGSDAGMLSKTNQTTREARLWLSRSSLISSAVAGV